MAHTKKYEDIINLMIRNVESKLLEKEQFFCYPSTMKISYSHTHEQKLFFSVKVSHINRTLLKGIGFAMVTMFEALESMGFQDMRNTIPTKDGGYQYQFSIELSELQNLT